MGIFSDKMVFTPNTSKSSGSVAGDGGSSIVGGMDNVDTASSSPTLPGLPKFESKSMNLNLGGSFGFGGGGGLFGSMQTMHGQGNLANVAQPEGTVAAPPPPPPQPVEPAAVTSAPPSPVDTPSPPPPPDPEAMANFFNKGTDLNLGSGGFDLGLGGGFSSGANPLANLDTEKMAKGAELLDEYRQSQIDAANREAKLQTVDALPSMPSISNVGSVPFSGSVNWNAIPGGFQPLPQTAGGRKRLYQLSKFHGGINQKSSPRDISDAECQEAANITFSHIGRVKLLGDIKSTDNSITTHAINTADRNAAGYGLFQFTSPADWDGANQGEYNLTLSADGDRLDIHDPADGAQAGWMDYGNSADNHDVAQVIYAAGNGVYASDANFANTSGNNPRKAKIYVHREDAGDSQTVSGWKEGKALIDSPKYDSDADGDMVAGSVKCTHDGGTAAANGSMIVECAPSSSAGNWSGTYHFYCTWLFDSKTETGMTAFGTDDGDDKEANGIAMGDSKALEFNISLKHTPHASNNTELGADKRIEGGRIYFRAQGETERYLLAEFLLSDGVKGALDTTYTPWDEVSDVYSHDMITFTTPPSVYTYASLNGYYPNEIYGLSPLKSVRLTACRYNNDPTIELNSGDTNSLQVGMYVYDTDGSGDIPAGAQIVSITDSDTFELSTATVNGDHSGSDQVLLFSYSPIAHDLRYKSAVIGQRGTVYIGNVKFQGEHKPDTMMYSMPGRPGAFPKFNTFDSPSSDGSPITALASYQDSILQFKENSMYVINVSNQAQFYAEASFRDCGVSNPCQIFTTPFGVIFANKVGCFIYDGSKVISLTSGKLDSADWDLPSDEASSIGSDGAGVPCVGFDPRSQSIIVLKDINDDSTDTGAWVYNMQTQSWTEGASMITNANGNRHSNFIISTQGYLSILRDDNTSLFNYNLGAASTQTITYWTKDLDFGLPSQTKRLFKVYITYKGDADSLTCAYGVDGETNTSDLYHFATDSWGGTTDTTPLLDKNSTTDLESWHVATLYPDHAGDGTDAGTEGAGWKSIALYFNGEVDSTFEINDISILYRVRPVK